jgi:hypothetical protein
MNLAKLTIQAVIAALCTLALLTAFGACQSCATTQPSPTPPAAIDAPQIPSCATACAHGAALGCSWAQPTPLGGTCEQVCTNAAQTVPWNVACLISITNCAAGDSCP